MRRGSISSSPAGSPRRWWRWGGFDLSGGGRRGARARPAAAGRPGVGELRFTRHGSLVMDWVEVFARSCSRRLARASGQPAGRCYSTMPFRVRDPDSGRFRIAFRVFAAMGYEGGRPRLWRAWLEGSDGRPGVDRRAIVDPKGSASLRSGD